VDDRPAASEQCSYLTQALAFSVHPGGFCALVWLERMLAPAMLTATLRFGHASYDTLTDLLTFEFGDLRHDTEHQSAGWRGQVNAECGDDDMDAAIPQPFRNLQCVQG
jgi:hypothetical protein